MLITPPTANSPRLAAAARPALSSLFRGTAAPDARRPAPERSLEPQPALLSLPLFRRTAAPAHDAQLRSSPRGLRRPSGIPAEAARHQRGGGGAVSLHPRGCPRPRRLLLVLPRRVALRGVALRSLVVGRAKTDGDTVCSSQGFYQNFFPFHLF